MNTIESPSVKTTQSEFSIFDDFTLPVKPLKTIKISNSKTVSELLGKIGDRYFCRVQSKHGDSIRYVDDIHAGEYYGFANIGGGLGETKIIKNYVVSYGSDGIGNKKIKILDKNFNVLKQIDLTIKVGKNSYSSKPVDIIYGKNGFLTILGEEGIKAYSFVEGDDGKTDRIDVKDFSKKNLMKAYCSLNDLTGLIQWYDNGSGGNSPKLSVFKKDGKQIGEYPIPFHRMGAFVGMRRDMIPVSENKELEFVIIEDKRNSSLIFFKDGTLVNPMNKEFLSRTPIEKTNGAKIIGEQILFTNKKDNQIEIYDIGDFIKKFEKIDNCQGYSLKKSDGSEKTFWSLNELVENGGKAKILSKLVKEMSLKEVDGFTKDGKVILEGEQFIPSILKKSIVNTMVVGERSAKKISKKQMNKI